MSSPNIVFIHVDQWRADCLSIEGHPVVHTPFLDKLALEGVRFSRAYASCPTCIPSRASLMTGLAPANHGRVGYQDGIPWNYPVTLPGEFTKRGYQTHCVGKLHAFPERDKLGFETVELHDGYLHYARNRTRNPDLDDDYVTWLREQTGRADADYFEHGVHCNSIVARPWPMEERLHPTNWAFTRGIDFLARRDRDRPFFLYLSLHRPHPPYDPPAWALEQYLAADMPPVAVGDWVDVFADRDNSRSPEAHRAIYRPDILKRGRAGYYGHMTHIDHQVSRFMEMLQEHRLDDDTWVIFTSDHGEMMGDHHLFRKGYPYEGSARLPLIMRPPSKVKCRRGSVCDTVVELRDYLPTLLDCAGHTAPEGLDGHSFLPHLLEESAEPLRPWLHGEHTLFGGSLQWLTDGRFKYVWHSGTGVEQLFDLIEDPRELHDLARSGQADPAPWRTRLATELRDREEGFVDANGQLIVGRPVHPVLRKLREG
jgi:arylsulfatase